MVSPLPGEKMSNWPLTQLITTKDVFSLLTSAHEDDFYIWIISSGCGFVEYSWIHFDPIFNLIPSLVPTRMSENENYETWLKEYGK